MPSSAFTPESNENLEQEVPDDPLDLNIPAEADEQIPSTNQQEVELTEEKFQAEQRRLKLVELEASIAAKRQVVQTQMQIEANEAAQEQFYLDAARAQRALAKYLEARLGK